MINATILFPILASFFITLLLLPVWIKRAQKAGLVGKDIQKIGKSETAEAGGVIVMVGFTVGIMLLVWINTFLLKTNQNFVEIFAMLSSLLMISYVAFTDDILGWKIGLRRRTRLILIAFATIPLVAINAGKSVIFLPFLGPGDLGILYPMVLVPIGIIGATTTYNFLAGFNGLEAGQGVIILSAMAIVTFLTGNSWLGIIAFCMVAALLAFLLFNFYPAKVFPGDSLTYPVGGLIAIISILGNFERIAIFFFSPYILETILKTRGKLVKESFGEPQPDGSLELKYNKIYSLTHLSIFIMKKLNIKPTERKVVLSIWTFQILVIVAGLIIFREGVFRL